MTDEQTIIQKTITTSTPRVVLRKNSKGYNWDLASSEGETFEEIIKVIEEANKIMLKKWGKR